MSPTVGFLHPGAMGSAMAACCAAETLWVSDGRSAATAERAVGLTDAGTLASLADRSDIIISICPPDAAVAVATSVAATGFDGVYVDANAISPGTSRSIAESFSSYVDATVVGPPPAADRSARLFIAGDDADQIAALWQGSPLEPIVLADAAAGAASAVKMTYAGWTKGTTALVLALVAYAEAEGVTDAIKAEWARSQPDLERRIAGAERAAPAKAWRFAGEMDEIAAALSAAGLPGDFHHGAAAIYHALADFKDRGDVTIDDLIASLLA